MITHNVKATLINFREDFGGYIIYVFEMEGGTLPYDKYVMCTRFPNWESPIIRIGDSGYLKYREVTAGDDKWYDSNTGNMIPYKYSDMHFIDFIPDKKKDDLLTL